MGANSMPWLVYSQLRIWPIPMDRQLLSHEMLGPFPTIPSIFESNTYGPAEVFGSSLNKYVGQFNAMGGAFSK
jgi:hypothetical protein